jgi:hypothetical protein
MGVGGKAGPTFLKRALGGRGGRSVVRNRHRTQVHEVTFAIQSL